MEDTIVSKVRVMDMLALYLDRSVCPGSRDVPLTQRWEHLADEFKVPEEKKKQCENFTGTLSPSENMFNYLCVTNDSLIIKTIKEKLKQIRRNDIVAKLQKNRLLRGKTFTNPCLLYLYLAQYCNHINIYKPPQNPGKKPLGTYNFVLKVWVG